MIILEAIRLRDPIENKETSPQHRSPPPLDYTTPINLIKGETTPFRSSLPTLPVHSLACLHLNPSDIAEWKDENELTVGR